MRLIAKGKPVVFWEYPDDPQFKPITKMLPDWKEMPELLKDGSRVFRRQPDGSYHGIAVPDVNYMPICIHFHVEGDIDGYTTHCGKDNRGGHWGSVTDEWDHVTCANCLDLKGKQRAKRRRR